MSKLNTIKDTEIFGMKLRPVDDIPHGTAVIGSPSEWRVQYNFEPLWVKNQLVYWQVSLTKQTRDGEKTETGYWTNDKMIEFISKLRYEGEIELEVTEVNE